MRIHLGQPETFYIICADLSVLAMHLPASIVIMPAVLLNESIKL